MSKTDLCAQMKSIYFSTGSGVLAAVGENIKHHQYWLKLKGAVFTE